MVRVATSSTERGFPRLRRGKFSDRGLRSLLLDGQVKMCGQSTCRVVDRNFQEYLQARSHKSDAEVVVHFGCSDRFSNLGKDDHPHILNTYRLLQLQCQAPIPKRFCWAGKPCSQVLPAFRIRCKVQHRVLTSWLEKRW